jgi:predicted AlkP superfamily phosphohydrolase/phosphomutase
MLTRFPRRWTIVALSLLAGCAAASRQAAPPSPQRPAASRVVLLSIDANANWILDRILAEGGASAFANMAKQGVRAEGLVSAMPSLTAVAHATLWTGTWSRWHGVAANSVARLPKAEHTVLESDNGFDSGPLVAEPIWEAAARAGKRVLVLQATGGWPFRQRYPDRVTQFDTYGTRLLPAEIIDGSVASGGHRFMAGETALTIAADGERLVLQSQTDRWSLTPGLDGAFSPPVPVRAEGRDARVRFRLLSFDRASGRFRLFRGVANMVYASAGDTLAPFLARAGALVGESVGEPYRRGDFGPTLADGGRGDAERWALEILEGNHEYFEGALSFAATQPWDLLVSYISTMDATVHAFAGVLDPSSEAWTPELERAMWPFVRESYERFINSYVASIFERIPGATVVIGTDHGIEGSSRSVLPNVALRKAGLLQLDADERIDLARSKAVFVQGRGMMIFVNTTDWKEGIVPPGEKVAVKRAVAAALLSIRHPVTGAPVIRAVYDPDIDGPGLGIGGERGGDLYFDPAPGFYTSGGHGDQEVTPSRPLGDGIHGMLPTRRRLHGAFYAAGPGIARGRTLGLVQAIDVAPTVAALLGIEPPAQARGRALDIW